MAKFLLGFILYSFSGLAFDTNDNLNFIKSVEEDNISLAEKYLKKSKFLVRVWKDSYTGRKPIHLARSKTMIDLLLKYKADINAQDSDGMTALHLNVWYFDEDLVNHLLDRGASIYIKNNDDHLPIIFASEYFTTKTLVRLSKPQADLLPREF